MLDAGYYAAGIAHDGSLAIFNEAGEYDQVSGDITFGSRADSISGTGPSPWAGFDLTGPANLFHSGLRFADADSYERRVTVGFEGSRLGFSVGYGDPNFYDAPAVQVSLLLRQASGLGEGSGGRDGSYFFNGGVLDAATGRWSFYRGASAIAGLDVTGTRTGASGDDPFVMQLDPNAVLQNGYTLFADSSDVAYFGDDLGAFLQTDLDDADGLQSFWLGMRTEAGTSFTEADFAGDVYAISLTGSAFMGNLVGRMNAADDPGSFTFTGALEFADDGSFRIYDLLHYYQVGRADASWAMHGEYEVIGDTVRLTSSDGGESLDVRFNADLSLALGVEYTAGGVQGFVFGGGPRILDGAPGDIPGPPDPDDEPLSLPNATRVIGDDGDIYLIGRTAHGEEHRFNVAELTGHEFSSRIGATWDPRDDWRPIESLEVEGQRLYSVWRTPGATWVSDLLTDDPAEIPATKLTVTHLPDGRLMATAFNADGQLVRYTAMYRDWEIEVISDVQTPDGAPAAPTDSAAILTTPWHTWHLFYLDQAGDLRVLWQARWDTPFFDNNLSLRAGLAPIDGDALDVAAGWGSIHVGVMAQGSLHGVWWHDGFGGTWVDTDFTGIAGADAGGLDPTFVGVHTDAWTRLLYHFAIDRDKGEVVIFRWSAAEGWTTHSYADWTIPEGGTAKLDTMGDDGRNISLRGRVRGAGDLPLVSRLFTDRTLDQRDQDLLDFLTPSLVEPIEG